MSIDNYNSTQQIYTKPNLSYAAIIAEAIICSPEKKLTLREIYFTVNSRYPFFSLDKTGWQNSIRHNLSLNNSFYKLPKTNATSTNSKGSYWCINNQDAYLILNKGKRPNNYQQQPIMYNTQPKYNTIFQKDFSYNRIDARDFGSFSKIDVRNIDDNNKDKQSFNNIDNKSLRNPFLNRKYDEY